MSVYFIQAVGGGPVKIGWTGDEPSIRLAALQTGSPVPLRILATLPGPPALERELHARFAGSRSHGEWFTPTEELRSFLGIANGSEVVALEGFALSPRRPLPKTWDESKCRLAQVMCDTAIVWTRGADLIRQVAELESVDLSEVPSPSALYGKGWLERRFLRRGHTYVGSEYRVGV